MYQMSRPASWQDPVGKYTIAHLIERDGVCPDSKGLADRIRNDNSFDVAVPTKPTADDMGVQLRRSDGRIPIFTRYSRAVIKQAIAQLGYVQGNPNFDVGLPNAVELPHFTLDFKEDIALYDALDIALMSSSSRLTADPMACDKLAGILGRALKIKGASKFSSEGFWIGFYETLQSMGEKGIEGHRKYLDAVKSQSQISEQDYRGHVENLEDGARRFELAVPLAWEVIKVVRGAYCRRKEEVEDGNHSTLYVEGIGSPSLSGLAKKKRIILVDLDAANPHYHGSLSHLPLFRPSENANGTRHWASLIEHPLH